MVFDAITGGYMELDLVASVSGSRAEEHGEIIKHIVLRIVEILKKRDTSLDLRRMRRVIVTSDFAEELASLSSFTASGNDISHTNEVYATAIAKVLLFPDGDDIEIVPVLHLDLILPFLDECDDAESAQMFSVHTLHHELCHVHDDNKKIDAFPGIILKQKIVGKDIFNYPLAEAVWSEYFATRKSSVTAIDFSVSCAVECFVGALKRTKSDVDKAIYEYRLHGDLDQLLSEFGRHGGFLVKSSSYLLGYMDGLNKTLGEISPIAEAELEDSYFQSTWDSMHVALQEMHQKYPDKWEDLGIYGDLIKTMDIYHNQMGFFFSDNEDGRTYVDVPLTPETTPMY